ncbi:hypothetical protein MRX96_000628 [Rhipicephalus microplus]
MVSTQTAMPPPAPPPAVSSPMNVQQLAADNGITDIRDCDPSSEPGHHDHKCPPAAAATAVAHRWPHAPALVNVHLSFPQQAIQSMTQSQLQPVQVIQQSLPNHYLPQLYSQQMMLPGNLAIQQHSMGALQGLNLQLQSKAHVDHTKQGGAGGTAWDDHHHPRPCPLRVSTQAAKGVTISSAPTLVTTNCHMMGTAGKPCLPTGQMIPKGTTVMGHGGYQLPQTSTSQQTLVINPLGLISGQSILPAATQAKQMDANKAKPFMVKHASLMSQKVMSQQTPLQPKSPLMANTVNAHGSGQMATAQVINTNQFKQLSQNNPQIISSQQPTVISQAQLLGSLQALNATFPHGITWAQPGQLQGPTLLSQNPIYIRSQQSDVFLQPGPQQALHALPVATAQPAVAQAQPQQPQPIQQQPPKPKQVRPASSVATQTATSTAVTVNSHVLPARSQAKPRIRAQTNRTSPAKTSAVVNIEPKPANMQSNQSQSHQQQAQNTNMVNHGTPGNHAATANAPMPSSAPSHTTQSHPTASHGTPNSHSVTGHSTMGRAATPTSHAASPSHPTGNLTVAPNHSPSIHVSLPSSTVHGITSHSGPCHTSVSHMTSTHVSVTPTSVTHTSSTTHPTMVHAPVGSHIAAAHVPGPHMGNHHLTGNAVSGGLSVSSHVAVAPQQKATVGVPSPPVAAPPPAAVKGSAEDKVEVSAPPEAAMPYDKQGGESGQKPEAMTNGGAVTPQMTMLTASEPVRQISQKPVVKPNVLTHVIEGYIIQEGPEPFPVSRSSLVAETESPKPSVETNGKAGSDEIQHIAQVPPSEAEPLPSKVAASGSDRVELAKCEMCGKLGTKSKFKKSKRFCSSSCVKRYNLACSERLGIFAFTSEPENEDELPGKVTKKKKMGRKSWRKPQGNHFNEYSPEKWVRYTDLIDALISSKWLCGANSGVPSGNT